MLRAAKPEASSLQSSFLNSKCLWVRGADLLGQSSTSPRADRPSPGGAERVPKFWNSAGTPEIKLPSAGQTDSSDTDR